MLSHLLVPYCSFGFLVCVVEMPPESKPSAEPSKILTPFFSKASSGEGAGNGHVVKLVPAAKVKDNIASPKFQDAYQNQAPSSPVYPKHQSHVPLMCTP